MVTVRDLTVEIDGQTILDKVSFQLAELIFLPRPGR
jgi:ABC-type hemin transport system ATPase subunit